MKKNIEQILLVDQLLERAIKKMNLEIKRKGVSPWQISKNIGRNVTSVTNMLSRKSEPQICLFFEIYYFIFQKFPEL
jgi:hypothetical protein